MKLGIVTLKRAVARVELRMSNRPPATRLHDLAVVRRVVADEVGRLAGVAPEHVVEAASLVHRWGLDELDRIQLAIALEDRLRLVERMDQGAWRTVGDVVRDAARTPAALD